MGGRRSIARDRDFEIIAIGVFGSAAAADAALEVVEFALAHEESFDAYPTVAQSTRGPVRAIKTIATKTLPSCIVLFTVEEGTVYLISIRTSMVDDSN